MIDDTNNNIGNNHPLSQAALNVVLVLVETLLTLLLRFDANLRQIVYPLAQDNVVVCIRSYLPHATIYATFTVNGILLDSELRANQRVDVTINGFTWEIAQAIFLNKASIIDKLQLRGELDKVAQVKSFLLAVGLAHVVQNLIENINGKKRQKTEQEATEPKTNIADYRARIAEQQNQINQISVDKTQLQTQLLELQSKNKFLKICLIIVTLLAIGFLIGWLMQ